ncbi:hypothetical protein QBC47DRAFT_392050 [Echria macrotheca]|uniref:Uncharacterized protein n=1 Tax=Echria macrotheca TaxID=438768 RepID=A0AAJ0B550_9PEZI|nr:hypothetical protein QBC47DRAFT_392050 [Echria macrotheca]
MPKIFPQYSTILYIVSLTQICLSFAQEDGLANFGDTVQVLGQMARTDQDFVDGFAIDLFSPTNRTLVVTNNTSPLPGNFVTGSSGEGFVNLSSYSWVIKMNESANDLIAKVELPYDPVALQRQGIDLSNTYVGTLAADGKSWVVAESQRNVHITENKTRIIKMTSLDGEYMLLGRKSADTTNIFVQYGQGATRTVNVTGGSGVQEAEFIDGLRFTIQSTMSFTMNVDIINGIDQAALPGGVTSLNTFAWVINTTMPSGNVFTVNMSFPVNEAILAQKSPGSAPGQLILARSLSDTKQSGQHFVPVEKQMAVRGGNSVRATALTQLDGRYVLLLGGNILGSGSNTDDDERRRYRRPQI